MDKKPVEEGFRGSVAEEDVEGHGLRGPIAPEADDVEGHLGGAGSVREPVRRPPVETDDDEDVEGHGFRGN